MGALRELDSEECEAFLAHSRVARLAVRDGEGVYIVPISYAYSDGAIYGHSPRGKKTNLLRQWPQVAVLVDQIVNLTTWRSVVAQGHWRELLEENERVHARGLLLRAFEGQLWLATAGHGHRTTLADAILYRIDIEETSGRAQNL